MGGSAAKNTVGAVRDEWAAAHFFLSARDMQENHRRVSQRIIVT
jgi:hypothetical protein